MASGEDPRLDPADFEEQLSRIEAELRALFTRYGEMAGPVPERLLRLAEELERRHADVRARAQQRAAEGPRAEDEAPHRQERAAADRQQG